MEEESPAAPASAGTSLLERALRLNAKSETKATQPATLMTRAIQRKMKRHGDNAASLPIINTAVEVAEVCFS